MPQSRRSRLLASAAVAAVLSVGAIGGTIYSAEAAAVATGDLPQQSLPSFAPIVERVRSAVVAVKVDIEDVADAGEMQQQMQNLPPEIQQFLHRFGSQNGQNGMPQPRGRSHGMAMGSGFFISSDGFIVTNNHVVQHAKTVSVTMDDGTTLDAKVVGTDPKTDLAVLKVKQSGDFPYVTLAKELPKTGDWVVAIGNPFGLGGTVTAGIVSASGRDIGSGPYDDYLQIDAPINKGNSGGPTFNLRGEVVGVNTAIYSPSGGSVGLAFAVPSTTIRAVVGSLEQNGHVDRGYLGVQIQPVNQAIADGLGLKTAKGALVDTVQPGTAAAEAGLKSGDVITEINGMEVKDARDLSRHVAAFKPGEKVKLTYVRKGETRTASLALGQQSNEKTASLETSSKNDAAVLGVQLAPAGQVPGGGDKGVVVLHVDPEGLAAKQGLSDGDVILEVAGNEVSSPADVKAGIASAKHDGKKAVLMRVKTAEGQRFVAIVFAKA
ncbi:MAG: Do family serine endopeptidase [Beijerinckiaceae bacterium]|nr:Do family serine endopeptidase [Beijerinckiaceae bacterium]